MNRQSIYCPKCNHKLIEPTDISPDYTTHIKCPKCEADLYFETEIRFIAYEKVKKGVK
jgi:predicted nucleic-acid-binding Zn-ribbon protein